MYAHAHLIYARDYDCCHLHYEYEDASEYVCVHVNEPYLRVNARGHVYARVRGYAEARLYLLP